MLYIITMLFNLENVDVFRRFIIDENGDIEIKKINFARACVCLVALFPILLLNDEFFITIMLGSLLAPFFGLFLPVT